MDISGFFEVTSPTLLDRLGVNRVDRDKQSQRKEACKKLEEIGVTVYPKGRLYLVNETELNEQMSRIFNSPSHNTFKPKDKDAQNLMEKYG